MANNEELQKLSDLNIALEVLPVLMGDQLGRDYFNRIGDVSTWQLTPCKANRPYHWMQLLRVPIPPAKSESYNLLEKWESVLSAMHTMQSEFSLTLIRRKGQTQLFLGAYREGEDGTATLRKLDRAARVHMRGIGLKPVQNREKIKYTLQSLPNTGIITGLPSPRYSNEEHINLLQTLDKLSYGVVDDTGNDHDYALVVIAQPVQDAQIANLTETLLRLRGEVHGFVSRNVTNSSGQDTGMDVGISGGALLQALFRAAGSMAGSLLVPGMGTYFGGMIGEAIGASLKVSTGVHRSNSTSTSSSYEERNDMAQYCEELINKHMQRLQAGRSLGFWNTGVYVLGDDYDAVEAVLGMLRSIYSGNNSYLEPIRAFNTGKNAAIKSYIQNLCLLPLPGDTDMRKALGEAFGLVNKNSWHVFGPLYESFSTPLTTQELSITTSLPRQDVPGLRFVKNAVKMTANAPMLPDGTRAINLGSVIDMGMKTGLDYALNIDGLVRHVLNDGLTGYGKSTTTHRILEGLGKHNVPWLVIEPVKTDYVEWAMAFNRNCKPEERISIYMPGYKKFFGQELEIMRFNPFQPCAPKGAPLNIQGHLDMLAALLTQSISMGEVLPLLMKEALQNLANDVLGVNIKGELIAEGNQVEPSEIQCFPKFSQMLEAVQNLMKTRGYAAENHQNLTAAMNTRIKCLLQGWKQDFFDADFSTEGEDLFNRKVIINLIGIEADEDKAFFMALILRALAEYRSAAYYYTKGYYDALQHGDRLMHFTVVEEAHRLISAPSASVVGAANPGNAAANMFAAMLREVRKWGEGLMIVDQQPSGLISDAIKNTNLKIIHRMPSEDDRSIVGACMGLNEEQTELIAQLNIGETIIKSDLDDSALWVKVHAGDVRKGDQL